MLCLKIPLFEKQGPPILGPSGPFGGRFGEHSGGILEAVLASFLDHFSDVVFGSILVRIVVNFGAV